MTDYNEEMAYLVRLLEQGGYNAAPSKLRSGCISFAPDVELTEEEADLAYEEMNNRSKRLLCINDVEHAVIDEMRRYFPDHQVEWTPINNAFDRLRKLAASRATTPTT